MELPPLILLIILLTIFNTAIQAALALTDLQGKKLFVRERLQLLNKPAKKSFLTKYGDIVDCVEINKQLAFDHPLLKNHSIQMKPSFITTKTSERPTSLFLPKNMRCPQGTVPVKRIQEEDLAMEKFRPLFGISTSNITNDNGHQIAGLIGTTKNTGVSGKVNVWKPIPEVKPGQFSTVSLMVGSDDGDVTNAIQAGWAVNPSLYPDSTRLFTYWTRNSGQGTGCYNTLCPGFVQTSQKIFLGHIINPLSKEKGDQFFVDVHIEQDIKTKHWWLSYEGEKVGYWPKELFSTLANGATRAGWGAEIYSQKEEEAPGMGAGWEAKAGYSRACLLKNLQVLNPDLFPKKEEMQFIMTDPKNYTVMYGKYGDLGNSVYVGGPRKL